MAQIRKKKYNIQLSEREYKRLLVVAGDPEVCDTLRMRSKILLALDEVHGDPDTIKKCADRYGISTCTVYHAVQKYSEEGINALLTIKRNPRQNTSKTKLTRKNEKRLYELADSPPPEGHKRWTCRLLAQECAKVLDQPVSKDTISRALRRRNA